MLNQAQDPCKCNGEARVSLVLKVRMPGEPRVKQVAMEELMDMDMVMVMAVVVSALKAKELKKDSEVQAWEDSVLKVREPKEDSEAQVWEDSALKDMPVLKVKPALKVRELKEDSEVLARELKFKDGEFQIRHKADLEVKVKVDSEAKEDLVLRDSKGLVPKVDLEDKVHRTLQDHKVDLEIKLALAWAGVLVPKVDLEDKQVRLP